MEPRRGLPEPAQSKRAGLSVNRDFAGRWQRHLRDGGAPVVDPRGPLVHRANHETPRVDHELTDARCRARGSIGTGPERGRRRLPLELQQLGRVVGHLHEAVGQALLQPPLAQLSHYWPELVAELLEHPAHRVGAVAKDYEGGRLSDGDQAEIAVAGVYRPPAADFER